MNKLTNWELFEIIVNSVWEVYEKFASYGLILLFACFVIFGGEIKVHINFHSIVDLWNTIFKK